MPKKDRQPNQNLSKLVSQVKALSKTVDELEKEIEALKLKICRNKDKKPTTSSNESKKVTNATSKSSPFRLKFFRKSDKTKENETPNKSSMIKFFRKSDKTKENATPNNSSNKKIQTRKKDDSSRDAISSNTSASNSQPSSEKIYADDSNEVKVKSKRKSEFTQTSNHSNQSTQGVKPRTQRQVQVNYSKSDTCCGRSRENKSNNLRKSRTDKDKIKSKRKVCSDNCSYLPKQSHYDNVENNSRKPFKNKKLMVNLIGSNKDFRSQIRRNKNFVLDCNFLRNADFAKLTDAKAEKRRRKVKLFSGDDGRQSRSLKDCKHCSKNHKTKNVLKIKKAILTQEPPMIFMSPDLEKSKICCGKKKHKWKCKKLLEDTEIFCEDCCPSLKSGRADNCNSFTCPCSSFAHR